MTSRDLQVATNQKYRSFYGYTVVLAAFPVIMVAHGIYYSFGVFLEPLINEFGWTRAVTSGAYSLCALVAGFLGIVAGRLSDYLGPKAVVMAGGFLLALGLILMSRANAVWQVYILYGVIAGMGIGTAWTTLTSTVARWFVLRRGLMIGIVASSVGFGTILIPLLASRLITVFQWRTAYVILGIASLIIIAIAALFLKREPSEIGQLPDGKDSRKQEALVIETKSFSFQDAVRTWQFWAVSSIYLCFGFSLLTIMGHIVIYATGIGISPGSAASILAFIGGANIIGRITVGSVSDRFGIKRCLVFTLLIVSITLLSLQIADQLWMLYLFAIFFGLSYGGIISLQPLLAADFFGLNALGVLGGSFAFAFTIGGAIGPFLSGHIFDVTRSYELGFLLSAILTIVSMITGLLLRPIAKRMPSSQ